MKKTEIVDIDISELKEYEKNPRRIGKEEYEKLKKKIQKFGDVGIITIDEKNRVIGGNQRVRAIKEIGGVKTLQARVLYGYSETELKEINLLLNNSDGEYDAQILKEFLSDVDETFDIDMTGLDDIKLELIKFDRREISNEYDEEGKKTIRVNKKLYEFKDVDMDEFEPDGYYGIPKLLKDKMVTKKITKVKTWIGDKYMPFDESQIYLHLNGTPDRGLNYRNVIEAFYRPDEVFNKYFTDYKQRIPKLIKKGIRMAVMPNYSVWANEPRACHIWASFRSKWVARIMQEHGISLIPDINLSDEESLSYTLLGIPKYNKYAMIQNMHVEEKTLIEMQMKCVRKAHNILEWETLLIYGADDAKKTKLYDLLKKDMNIIYVDSFMNEKRKILEGGRE